MYRLLEYVGGYELMPEYGFETREEATEKLQEKLEEHLKYYGNDPEEEESIREHYFFNSRVEYYECYSEKYSKLYEDFTYEDKQFLAKLFPIMAMYVDKIANRVEQSKFSINWEVLFNELFRDDTEYWKQQLSKSTVDLLKLKIILYYATYDEVELRLNALNARILMHPAERNREATDEDLIYLLRTEKGER